MGYGLYRGTEQLACGAQSCRKVYANLALKLAHLAAVGGACTLAFEATAHGPGQAFAGGLPVGGGVSYPYVVVASTLTSGGAPVCQDNPLDGAGSAVGEYVYDEVTGTESYPGRMYRHYVFVTDGVGNITAEVGPFTHPGVGKSPRVELLDADQVLVMWREYADYATETPDRIGVYFLRLD